MQATCCLPSVCVVSRCIILPWGLNSGPPFMQAATVGAAWASAGFFCTPRYSLVHWCFVVCFLHLWVIGPVLLGCVGSFRAFGFAGWLSSSVYPRRPASIRLLLSLLVVSCPTSFVLETSRVLVCSAFGKHPFAAFCELLLVSTSGLAALALCGSLCCSVAHVALLRAGENM